MLQSNHGAISSDPTRILREALTTFEGELDQEQKTRLHTLGCSPGANVIDIVTQLDAQNQGKSRRCVAPRILTFLNHAQQFTGVVDTFVSSNPSIAALIWGSIRLAIVLASNITSYFEKVSELIMKLGKTCPSYEKFGSLFPGCVDLQRALCEYYAVIVRICSKIVGVLSRSSLNQVFSSMWNPFDTDFKPLLRALEEASGVVNAAISLASTETALQAFAVQKGEASSNFTHRRRAIAFQRKARAEFGKNALWREEQIEKERRRLHLSIEQNISSIDYLKPWRQARRERVGGTANWFLDEEGFRQWQHAEHSNCTTLLCSGTMGAGKTILASEVIAHLSASQEHSHTIAAYYFCRSDVKDSLSAKSVLGSLVYQMLQRQLGTLSLHALKKMHFETKGLEAHDMTEFAIQNSDKSQEFFIVLDGLDECEESHVREIVHCLSSIQKEMNFKIFYTGRPELSSIISRFHGNLLQIKFGRNKNGNDIAQYIDSKIHEYLENDRMKLSDLGLVYDISKALENGSEGMFLWARLLLDELCEQNSDNDIISTLKRLPRTMSELLSRRLNRVQSKAGASHALQALRYSGVVKRPLSSNELGELLGTSVGQTSFDRGSIPHDMVRVIADCCGMLQLDEEDDTIHYVHHSVKDFLFNDFNSQKQPSRFKQNESDLQVGYLCLTYLNFNDFERQIVKRENNLSIDPIHFSAIPISQSSNFGAGLAKILLKLRRQLPAAPRDEIMRKGMYILKSIHGRENPEQFEHHFYFLDYARTNWIYHLSDLDPALDPTMGRCFRRCLDGTNKMAVRPWLEYADSNEASQNPGTGRLEAIARWSLDHNLAILVMEVLTIREVVRLPLEVLSNIMLKLLRLKRLRLFKAILNYHEGIIGAPSERLRPMALSTVLVRGAMEGDLEVVRTIFLAVERHKTLIDTIVEMPSSLLVESASQGENLSQRLLNSAEEVMKTTALEAAVGEGHIDIVKLLVNHGADVNHTSHQGRTPLSAAVNRNHGDVVEVLLDAGADLHVDVDSSGRIPLIAQAESKSLELAAILKRSDANFRRVPNPNALSLAAQNGDADTIDVLLRSGASPTDVPVDQHTGRTLDLPIAIATKREHAGIVKALLAAGADPNSFISEPALHIAAKAGALDIVNLLVNAGVRLDDSFQGETPILVAAKRRRFEVVKVLSSKGANVSFPGVQDRLGHELIYAVRQGDCELVSTLLTAVTDVNCIIGMTALSDAVSAGHLDIVKRLIRAGITVNFPSEEQDCEPALFTAVKRGDTKILEYLLVNGADILAKWEGRSALQLARSIYAIECPIFNVLLTAAAAHRLPNRELLRSVVEVSSGMWRESFDEVFDGTKSKRAK